MPLINGILTVNMETGYELRGNTILNINRANNTDDKALLASFLKGDDNAFSSIYYKYVDELFVYGLSMGFERETLKDAIQDTFFRLYTNKKNLKEVQHLKYYLIGMLRNRLLDIYKSSGKENYMSPHELPPLLEENVLDNIIEQEEKRFLEQQVNNLLDVLTDRQKNAVYLRFIKEMEYEKIGSMLDMTGPAVRKLISRAMKRMREESF